MGSLLRSHRKVVGFVLTVLLSVLIVGLGLRVCWAQQQSSAQSRSLEKRIRDLIQDIDEIRGYCNPPLVSSTYPKVDKLARIGRPAVPFLVATGVTEVRGATSVSTSDQSAKQKFIDALVKAAAEGDLKEVDFLINKDDTIINGTHGEYSSTPLSNASSNGHIEIVKFLIEKVLISM